RADTRARPDLPADICATAAPSGSEVDPGCPVITRNAMAVTVTVAAVAVTMKTPTRLRFGRLAWGRLRCCANAVLPSAIRCRAERPARGPLRYRAASRMTAGLDYPARRRRGTTLPELHTATKRFRRKSCAREP